MLSSLRLSLLVAIGEISRTKVIFEQIQHILTENRRWESKIGYLSG
ncbi:hypothetical protein QUB50_19805 [Microcoleus sp. A6-C5]